MPMDGLMLFSVARELKSLLIGGRIDRIQQPERDEIHMMIRAGGKNHRLVLSSSANHARAHLSSVSKKSMEVPPQLCTLMRKHLVNGRIIEIEQIGLDRIIKITVESMDEIGDYTTKYIIVEIMGRHSNIILLNDEMRILDSASRITAEISRVREVLPHLPYQLPPSQDKLDGRLASAEEICEKLESQPSQTLDKALMASLSGLSQQAARELSYRLLMDEKAPPSLWLKHVLTISGDVKKFFDELKDEEKPVLFLVEGSIADVTSFVYSSRPEEGQRVMPSMSQALDEFYTKRDQSERMRQKTSAMHKTLSSALERCERKLAMQLEKREEIKNRDQLRVYGELIMSSIYNIKKGSRQAKVTDYYTEGLPEIEIPLDETLSPADNAQKYFKMYNKAKAAAELVEGQIKENQEEMEYLSALILNMEHISGEDELAEMREELVKAGYARRQIKKSDKGYAKRGGKPAKIKESKPYEFKAPDGSFVYVGKNNAQNDRLTFSAAPNDIWLHAKDMPGSHVIIRLEGQEGPSDETLLYAASLAAKFSKGKNSSLVPVDYTRRRYVKKPGGARPGFVVYTNERQIMARPME
ncbi:MAG: Rqc2 family fibronectin-binding protein [Christensenellales bacterium]|jgi:predicted ribosome quality control (RQC) complex YloA/Tae2 family protein